MRRVRRVRQRRKTGKGREKGRVSVFEAKPKYSLLADNDLKEEVYASPAVSNGKLYIRGVNTLFCFGKK